MNDIAQGIVLALIFVAVAIILSIVAIWSVMTMNIWGAVVGFVGEGAWIFAGKHII